MNSSKNKLNNKISWQNNFCQTNTFVCLFVFVLVYRFSFATSFSLHEAALFNKIFLTTQKKMKIHIDI